MRASPRAGRTIQFIPQNWRVCRVVAVSCGWGAKSVNLLGFAGHVIHKEILAEGVGSGEVGLAAAHGGDFLNEVDEGVVAGEHEGVDHDAGAFALVDFLESLAD